MKKNEILNKLAPCGIDCSRCVSFNGGPVSLQSRELLEALGSFRVMADKMSSFFPPFRNYDSFEKILTHFAEAGCTGCRAGDGKYPGCKAKSCVTEKGVDFCGECGEFPCGKNDYNEGLKQRWLENGQFIHEKGAEEFYRMQAGKPRY